MTKAKTNKELIEYGLGQDEILELVEMDLERGLNGNVHNFEWGGDDETTDLNFEDHNGRTWCVYYIDGEQTNTLFVHSYKNDEDRDEVNAKAFKSITAVVNHVKRIVGE